MPVTRVLVTGAGGFVGRALCQRLCREGGAVRAAIRASGGTEIPPAESVFAVGDISGCTDWSPICRGVDTVVHLAARAHVSRESAIDPEAAYRSVNVDGTIALAHQAVAAGVRRFVFVSSIGVMGDSSTSGPFRETDPARPRSLYARTKWEAERALAEICGSRGMELVVVRPPLVYGPGNPGNFLRLLQWVQKGIPLPLAGIDNRRSMVGLTNLVDFMYVCIASPRAANQTFNVADGEDLSIGDWIRRIANAMGRPARLFALPESLMRAAARGFRRPDLIARLLDSLEVDIAKARAILGWSAPVSVNRGLEETARWFQSRKQR